MISKINFSRSVSFYVGYEGDGGDPAGGDPAGGNPNPPTGPKMVQMTQEQLDKLVQDRLAKQSKSFNQEKQKLIDQLTQVQEATGTSEAQRQQLETQIEELRNSMLSREELEKRNKEKLEKEWQTKFDAADQTAKVWQTRHDSLLVGHDISKACIEHKVLPNSFEFMEALLKPKARTVEVLDDAGQPTGRYETKVKVQSVNKEGKPVELDVTIYDAVKLYKDQPEKYGNLFEGNKAGGLGGSAGQPGKPVDVRALAENPAEYMRRRKENPASLGLA